jgi:hypothetical protein
MVIQYPYSPRPVRFLGVYETAGWKIKIHGISIKNEYIEPQLLEHVKTRLPDWLNIFSHPELETYKIATLIVHEGKEGIFALLNWWIDENMLQCHVYFSGYTNPYQFHVYSPKGTMVCVWEMAVMWFERNAWVKHVLSKPASPDIEAYLADCMNENI